VSGPGRTRHGVLKLEMAVDAAPGRVFAHFAELDLRRRWFSIPGESAQARHSLDFRVGGGEHAYGVFAVAGIPETIEYRSRFYDIVPERRIVVASEALVQGRRRVVSLTTIELAAEATGTRLAVTEQYVLLDVTKEGDAEVAEREGGLRLQLNGLRGVVRSGPPRPPLG